MTIRLTDDMLNDYAARLVLRLNRMVDRFDEAAAQRPPPVAETTDGSWRDQAACNGSFSPVFWPDHIRNPNLRQQRLEAATAICRQCPVASACLEYAIATNQQFGVWGGFLYEDRRRIAKRRQQQRR